MSSHDLKIRSGIGYDLHRLSDGGLLYLGGVVVSEKMSFVAHSDGDVLIHSLIDALTGSLALPDIGEMFPDNDSQYKNISSTILLEKVRDIILQKGYEILNIDSVIVAQKPKIIDFKDKIRANLSLILKIDKDRINIKGKTKEEVDAVGRGEAIECYTIVMVRALK